MLSCHPLQVPLSQEKQLEKQARPDKLAIGGDGGFQLEEDKYEVEKSQALTVLPEGTDIALPCPELPEIILSAIKGVMVSLLLHLQLVHTSDLEGSITALLPSFNLCTAQCCPQPVHVHW